MLFSKTPKDGQWHPYTPWFLVRLEGRKLSDAHGKIWRRWKPGALAWEYKQEPETAEDMLERQAY
jgi:hypothetical protein